MCHAAFCLYGYRRNEVVGMTNLVCVHLRPFAVDFCPGCRMIGFWKKKEEAPVAPKEEKGFFKKLSEGLSKSSTKISSGITDIFTKKKLDAETLGQLEELLITADLGPATAAKLAAAVAKNRFGKEVSSEEIREALATEIEAILKPVEKPIDTTMRKTLRHPHGRRQRHWQDDDHRQMGASA